MVTHDPLAAGVRASCSISKGVLVESVTAGGARDGLAGAIDKYLHPSSPAFRRKRARRARPDRSRWRSSGIHGAVDGAFKRVDVAGSIVSVMLNRVSISASAARLS
jgi:hypothetical protein